MGTQSLIKYITETNSKATEADQINPYIIVLKIYGNNVKPKWNQPLRSNLALRKFYAYNNTVGGGGQYKPSGLLLCIPGHHLILLSNLRYSPSIWTAFL